ncbi:MAG: CHC2 zinc finger domain-containing protein [Armatimonadota bacterium]
MGTPSTVDQVKTRVSILDVIGKVVNLHQRGRSWWGCCPLHQENTPSLQVSPDNGAGVWHCFGCGAGGDVISFVQKHYRVGFAEALRILGGHEPSSPLPPTRVPIKQLDTRPSDYWRQQLIGLQSLAGSPGAEYLQCRGIDLEYAFHSEVLYHPLWYGHAPAVLFPIRNKSGELIAAEGRYFYEVVIHMGDKPIKKQTAGPKSQGVFSTPGAFAQPFVFLTEGPIDALTLAMCGIPTVATCSASNCVAWLLEVCTGKDVIIGFDPDSGGEAGTRQQREKLFLPAGIQPRWITPPCGDWNDFLLTYGREALTQRLREIIPHGGNCTTLTPEHSNGIHAHNSCLLTVGVPVADVWGKWQGTVQAVYPPDENFPAGWVEVYTDHGQHGQVDSRYLRHTSA